MDGSAHYRKAEELAAKAAEYLGRGDGRRNLTRVCQAPEVHKAASRGYHSK